MNLLGLVLVSAPSLAQVPASERIPLTDPARLKRMGFPSDARNVFVWSKLDRAGDASLDEKTAAARKTWGTQTGSTTVAAMALQKSLADSKLQHNLDLTFCTHSVPGGAFAVAQFQLPEGASLGDFNSWAFDADPDRDLYFALFETCQDYGYDDPVTTLIAENNTIGAIGNIPGTRSLGGLTVANHRCVHYVNVQFAGIGESCVLGLGIRKFEITWTRQVSPAPATATFDDVPTNHPFFQFVEALAKSEITGGCQADPPLYCPNAPLTRGQMAVFLAKALGLQWP